MAQGESAANAALTARGQVLGAALLFSTGGVAIKAIDLDGVTIAGLRSAIAAVLLIAALPRARRGLSLRVLPVSVAYALTLVLFTIATRLTTAANAIFIQDTAPLWVLLLGPWLLGESIARRDVPFIAAIATGMLLFFASAREPQATAPDPALGNWVALGASITWALALIGLRWLSLQARPGVDPGAAAAAVGNAIAVAICLPFMGPLGDASATDWAWVVYLGAVQVALAYVLLTAAAPRVPAFELALLLLVEPILTPVWTALVHGERPGALAVLGGVLVTGALALRTRDTMRAARGA